MIIREDGKRIDAIVNENYQETYNFGRTRNWKAHNDLDIAPHKANGRYALRQNMGSVKISDKTSNPVNQEWRRAETVRRSYLHQYRS